LEGPAAADFTLSENQCSRGELAPGASCAMKVVFTPRTAGSRTAKLVIAHDAAGAPANIGMQGRGTEPVVAQVTPRIDKATPPPPPQPTPPAERKPDVVAAQPKEPAIRPTPPAERKADVSAAAPKILRFDSKLVDDKVQLCYGVENAASAAITPEPGAVKPVEKECVLVAGGARKTYTLSARNAAGVVVTRAIAVEGLAKPQPAQLIAVPNVIGKSRRDATAELEKAGLEVRVAESKPDPKATVDSVVAQSP